MARATSGSDRRTGLPSPARRVALLRAINLGPHNKVGMDALRALAGALGLEGVRSVLQTGNLVFDADGDTTEGLERRFEASLRARLGLGTDVFVRGARDWEALIAQNPFPEAAVGDPSHLLVMCLRSAPAPGRAQALQQAISGREQVRVVGRQAYAVYPDGIGRSRLTMARIEQALGTRGTARNWNTVLRIGALLREP